ncbi:MAG: hypothetical protein ABIJ86_05120 [Spirochaetota bacterium]
MGSLKGRWLHIVFTSALLFVVAGAGLLAWTTGAITEIRHFRSLAVFFLGAIGVYASMVTGSRVKFLFMSCFFALGSLASFFSGLAGLSLKQYWPLLAVAAGISIIPTGCARYHSLKAMFIVPATTFILLGGFFSIFSLGFSTMRFRTFLYYTWPAFFISAGIILFLLWTFNRALHNTAKGGDQDFR